MNILNLISDAELKPFTDHKAYVVAEITRIE